MEIKKSQKLKAPNLIRLGALPRTRKILIESKQNRFVSKFHNLIWMYCFNCCISFRNQNLSKLI